jgi:hypothetical protein
MSHRVSHQPHQAKLTDALKLRLGLEVFSSLSSSHDYPRLKLKASKHQAMDLTLVLEVDNLLRNANLSISLPQP